MLFSFSAPRTTGAAWVQDDRALTPRLTLNLGLRYDVSIGALGESFVYPPFRPNPTPSETLNFQPRVGFAYALPNDKTVIRGGGGKYFAELSDQTNISRVIGQTATITIPNDGRPDFAVNPFNGPPPTFEVLSKSKGQDITTRVVSPDLHSAYSWQASLGIQHQKIARCSKGPS